MVSPVTSPLDTKNNEIFDRINGNLPEQQAPGSVQAIQDRFLKLLTTQLSTQDPLSPMDNGQITSQFAQLTQASGIHKLNETMQALSNTYASSQALMAANTIGRHVMVSGNQLTKREEGKDIQAAFKLDSYADAVSIKVKDANGNVVDTIQLAGRLPPGMKDFSWDGMGENNKSLPTGVYTFEVEASLSGTEANKTVGATPYMLQSINSVAFNPNSEPELVLSNGSRVALANVQQLF